MLGHISVRWKSDGRLYLLDNQSQDINRKVKQIKRLVVRSILFILLAVLLGGQRDSHARVFIAIAYVSLSKRLGCC